MNGLFFKVSLTKFWTKEGKKGRGRLEFLNQFYSFEVWWDGRLSFPWNYIILVFHTFNKGNGKKVFYATVLARDR